MKIYLNGKLVDEAEAKISVFDRGYLFGEGLFETFRSYDGKLPFLDKHLERMEWSSTFLGIPFPHPAHLRKGVSDLLEANKIKNARIKILISALNKGLRPSVLEEDNEINTVILCEPFLPWPDEKYEQGIDLTFIHSVKNDPPPASTVKAMNYLTKMIARREIAEKKTFDGILLTANGFVAETTSSNIFWVSGKKIHTPPTSLGLLPGVTRQIVINLIKEEGMEFSEQAITEEDLEKVSEIFLTGSTLEIMPVTQLAGADVGNGKPGNITQKIMEVYKDFLEDELKG